MGMNDLTKGREWKTILVFTLPMILGNLFQQLYNMVDGIVVGNYVGSHAFSAVGGTFSAIFLVVSLMIGISSGMSVIISQLYGARLLKEVKRAVSTMYIGSVLGGIVLSVIGYMLTGLLLRYVLAVPEEIYELSLGYVQIMMAGLVFQAVYNVLGAMLRALGDSKTPLYFLIVATIVNIVLDLVFVIKFHWGVNGVAIATIIAQAVSCIVGFAYVYKKVPIMRITGSEIVFDKKIFAESLRIGLPTGIQQMLTSLGIMAIQRLVNSFGVDTMAAYGAGSRIEQLVSMPLMQLQLAISMFVGQNIGAKQYDRVKRGYRSTMAMMLIWSAAGGAVLIALSHQLVALFVPEASGTVFDIGREYLTVMGLSMWVFSFMGTSTGLLRGVGDVMFPMVVTILAFAIRIAFAYAFASVWGTAAIWAALPIGWCGGSILAYIRYKGGKWKKMELVSRIKSGEEA